MSARSDRRLLATGLRTVVRHPGLALEAVRAAWGLRGDGAARRAYLDWRSLTAYGEPDHPTPPEELAEFLRWRRRLRRVK